jgi:hypothetical protein
MSIKPDPIKGLTHNHVFGVVILAIIAYLTWMCAGDPTLPINELTGAALHKLGLFLAVTVGTIWSLGGRKFDTVEFLKGQPVAFAILCASVILGAAVVLSK